MRLPVCRASPSWSAGTWWTSRRWVEAVKANCVKLIDEIESRGKDEFRFPPQASALCDWCEFRAVCPAMKHHIAVETLPPEEFKADAGVGLVDAWAEMRDRRRRLEEEAEALKAQEQALQERVVAFAAQQGITSVAGSTHCAAIYQEVELRIPAADDPARDAFEDAVRKAGLWPGVTAFSVQKFRTAWQRMAWSLRKAGRPCGSMWPRPP